MAWTIKWLYDRVGRRTGTVETWGQEDSLRKWEAQGWIKILKGTPAKSSTPPPAEETAPARGMGLRSFDRPPFDRSIQAPVKKKNRAKLKMRKGRR